MIEISETELCTVLCALRDAAATTTELALMTPESRERRLLMDHAEVFSGFARQLMQRQARQDDARYPNAAASAWEAGLRTGWRYPMAVPA